MVVTTGSILNTRMSYAPQTSGGGGGNVGVKTNSLQMTNLKLAARTGKPGTASYTSMSNRINGRAIPVPVNSGQCEECHGKPKTNLFGATLAFLSTPQGQKVLATGVNGLQKLLKSGVDGTKDVTTNTKTKGTGNASLNSIANDIKLSGDTCVSKMDGAKTSADLQAAIKDAETYLNGDLQTRRNEAKGKADVAQKKLDEFKENNTIENAEKDVKDAQQNVKTAKDGVSSFESKVGKEERNIQEANNELAKADTNYKTAMDNTAKGKADLATAKEGVTTAQGNVDSAQANVDNLKAQLASAPAEQKATIQAQLTTAEGELTKAQGELTKAKDAESKAETALKGFETAQDEALAKLDDSKAGVKEAKEKLADSKEKLEGAKKNLEAKQKELEKNEAELKEKQEALNDLENQKTQAETDIKNFEKLDKEYNSLKSEISSQKTRLTKMSQEEAKKMNKLDNKIVNAENKSDNAEADMNLTDQAQTGHVTTKAEIKAKNRMDKAEVKEEKLRNKKAEIENSHVSVDDIKLDEQISKTLDACDNLAHSGLSGNMAMQFVNGHRVTSQYGQFFIDGSKNGVDRAEAEKLLKE